MIGHDAPNLDPMTLVVCSACGCHVQATAASCPFCGQHVAARAFDARAARRVSRAALSMGAATAVVLSSCSAYGAPICPPSVALSAPCGFTSITTDCPHATATCDCCASNQCFVGPFATTDGTCSITATLTDGTTHTISVTSGTRNGCGNAVVVVSPLGVQDFSSATCQGDGGI